MLEKGNRHSSAEEKELERWRKKVSHSVERDKKMV